MRNILYRAIDRRMTNERHDWFWLQLRFDNKTNNVSGENYLSDCRSERVNSIKILRVKFGNFPLRVLLRAYMFRQPLNQKYHATKVIAIEAFLKQIVLLKELNLKDITVFLKVK